MVFPDRKRMLFSYIDSMKQLYVILIFISFSFCKGREAFAQSQVGTSSQKVVQYTPDFEFKDGVYLSLLDFKSNHPIPVSKIVFKSNKDDKDFLKYVMDNNTFKYTDSLGHEQEVKTNSAWGYCSNGAIYMNYGTDFNRVPLIGSICHFVASVLVRTGMNDPFYNQPFGMPQQQYTYVTQQFILDFESGNVLEFNVDNMAYILQRDQALYTVFMALKKKVKRNSIFLYMRKYNEKHPVYFPE